MLSEGTACESTKTTAAPDAPGTISFTITALTGAVRDYSMLASAPVADLFREYTERDGLPTGMYSLTNTKTKIILTMRNSTDVTIGDFLSNDDKLASALLQGAAETGAEAVTKTTAAPDAPGTISFTITALTGAVRDYSMLASAPVADLFREYTERDGLPTGTCCFINTRTERRVRNSPDVVLRDVLSDGDTLFCVLGRC